MNIDKIKKALECCLNPELTCCNDCPYNNNGRLSCLESEMLKDALNLINELEKENELLRSMKNEKKKIIYGSLITSTKCYNCIHFPLCFAQKGGANLELASENDCYYYQPKLPEDSVVLSREEYERLKRVENEKDRLYEIKIDLENQLIEKGWTDYEGADEIEKRVSKETAEKIHKKIKDSFLMDSNNRYALKLWIEQQFGVEIKE